MKYLFIAASLLFTFSGASAQTRPGWPTVQQNDSAMIAGRGLVSKKISDLKAADAAHNTTAFRTHAEQLYLLMRTGMEQTGKKIDMSPGTGGGATHYKAIERVIFDYHTLLNDPGPNNTAIIGKADAFKAIY